MTASVPLLLLLAAVHSFAATVTPATTTETPFGSAQVTVNVTLPEAGGNTVVTGLTNTTAGVDSFYGIPFAQPPVGNLRLRPPQPLNYSTPGVVSATATPVVACPQFYPNATQPSSSPLYLGPQSEDCLKLTIHRPTLTVSTSAPFPVMVWTYGGAFISGYSSKYDGTGIVEHSVLIELPIIHVEISYRVGPLGFLPGRAIKEDGAGNVGLLDQRMALQWVSDNIEAFGGDPNRVTIWGESAGSMSTFDQMLLNDGNNSYNGKSLFRGAIMDSGTIMPVSPIDDPKQQQIYDTILNGTGCNHAFSGEKQLDCLRSVEIDVFVEAANNLAPNLGSPFFPHVDGSVLTASPDILVQQGKYADIPFITGDQEDEGTIFAPSNVEVATLKLMTQWFVRQLYPTCPLKYMEQFANIYMISSPDLYGSPFHTRDDNSSGTFPAQRKRAAAIFGDLSFTFMRRLLLLTHTGSDSRHKAPCWSYMATYDSLKDPRGTYHGSDNSQIFNGTPPDAADMSTWEYYLSFVYYLDPNARANFPYWPPYDPTNRTLLNISRTEVGLFMKDDFREDAYSFVALNVTPYYM